MSKVFESLAIKTCHACGSATTREEVQVKTEYFYYDCCQNEECEWRKAQTHWDYERPVTPLPRTVRFREMDIWELEQMYSQQ